MGSGKTGGLQTDLLVETLGVWWWGFCVRLCVGGGYTLTSTMLWIDVVITCYFYRVYACKSYFFAGIP